MLQKKLPWWIESPPAVPIDEDEEIDIVGNGSSDLRRESNNDDGEEEASILQKQQEESTALYLLWFLGCNGDGSNGGNGV